MRKTKSRIINISLFIFVLFVGFIFSEFVFRSILFSENKAFEKPRNPGDYADPDIGENYWKLYYQFDGKNKPPKNPHPLLGWIGFFNPKSYIHNDFRYLKDKRPILLFGDSFAMCVQESKCFQEILNYDEEFLEDNYFLNYGVGGYGVGQISLLSQKTIPHYRKPFVIFSLLTYDLDRSVLSVRTGQKPYYKIEKDSLKLCGVPIKQNSDDFFENNSPQIRSYLFNKFLFSNLNFFPEKITSYFKGENEAIKKKIELNEKILLEVVDRFRENNIDFVFVIFHTLKWSLDNFGPEAKNNWRNVFLKNFLEKNNIPYIWTIDLIEKDTLYDKYDIPKYIIPGNGHPTTYFNTLIANEMKLKVLEFNEKEKHMMRNNNVEYYSDKMRSSEDWLKKLKEKAEKRKLSLDEMIRIDAEYMVRMRAEKQDTSSNLIYYSDQLEQVISKISNNPKTVETISEKAVHKNKSLSQAIYDESLYIVSQKQN